MSLLLAIALAAAAPDALARARALYDEADWDAALRALDEAEKAATEDAARASVLSARGVVLANVPDADAAQAAWERALLLDPEVTLAFPALPKIQQQFERVKRTVRAAREALLREQAAKKPAPEPAPQVAVEPAPPSRGPPLAPLISGAVALISGGVGLALGLSSKGYVDRAVASEWDDEKRAFYGHAREHAIAADVLFAVAGVAAVTALIAFLLSR